MKAICEAEHNSSDIDIDKSLSSDGNLHIYRNLNNFETMFYYIFILIKCLLRILLFHIMVLLVSQLNFLFNTLLKN